MTKFQILDSIAIRSFVEFYDKVDSVYTHFSKDDFFMAIDELDPTIKDTIFELLIAGNLIVPHQSPIICTKPRYMINVFIGELVQYIRNPNLVKK